MPSSGAACSTWGLRHQECSDRPRPIDGGGMASGNRDARHRGDGGQPVGNIKSSGISTSSGNIRDVGNIDNLRNAGNVGVVGNVRLRLGQHCCIVDPTSTSPTTPGGGARAGIPLGSYRDRQSRGQLRASGTDDKRIALVATWRAGANDPSIAAPPTVSSTTTSTIPCRLRGLKRYRRLLKQLFICERERP